MVSNTCDITQENWFGVVDRVLGAKKQASLREQTSAQSSKILIPPK